MHRIAILDDYQRVAIGFADWDSLRAECEIVTFSDHIQDAQVLAARLADFDVVMAMRERTSFPSNLLSRLPRLRLIVTSGKANTAIDTDAARERGILVCGTESLATPTVELAWGLILALARRIPAEDSALRGGNWQSTVGKGLHGKVLGIIGLGRIGSQVAQIGNAFGMTVLAWSPRLTPSEAAAKSCQYEPLIRLVAIADVISIHARLDASSIGLIGENELHAMKRSAVLVNTARAGLVDQAALIAALYAEGIAGYASDVFEVEPMPHGHPLLGAPNTVLTPHLGYVTKENYRLFYSQAVENIQAYLRGSPIRLIGS